MLNKGNIYACYNGTCNAIMRFQMQQADVKRFVYNTSEVELQSSHF